MENTQKVTQQNSSYKGHISANTMSFIDTNKGNTDVSLQNKMQKIVTALYMVTEHIDALDPLKTSIRKKGLEALETVSLALYAETYQVKIHQHSVERFSGELLSYLTIATTIGSMSQMNTMIIEKELHALVDGLREYGLQRESDFTPTTSISSRISSLSETFFTPEVRVQKEEVKHLKDTTKTVAENTVQEKEKASVPIPESKGETGIKTDRKMSIVKVIQIKKEATIKDIVSVVRDCSEKTIQRELMTLVAEGVLKKTGDKRWSRYSFA
jgi:hypothetical protein